MRVKNNVMQHLHNVNCSFRPNTKFWLFNNELNSLYWCQHHIVLDESLTVFVPSFHENQFSRVWCNFKVGVLAANQNDFLFYGLFSTCTF